MTMSLPTSKFSCLRHWRRSLYAYRDIVVRSRQLFDECSPGDQYLAVSLYPQTWTWLSDFYACSFGWQQVQLIRASRDA